jgi:hypothetical protein
LASPCFRDTIGDPLDAAGLWEAPRMMEVHVCNRDGVLLRAFALGDAEEVIIGRDVNCDIRIQAPSISREHCAIERVGEKLFLRDLGSTGGTYANGERLDRIELAPGLEIRVGPAILKFYEGGI